MSEVKILESSKIRLKKHMRDELCWSGSEQGDLMTSISSSCESAERSVSFLYYLK